MKRLTFAKVQIAFVLKEVEEGSSVADVCCRARIVEATFHDWREKGGVLMPSEVKRLKMRCQKIFSCSYRGGCVASPNDQTRPSALFQDVV